MMMTTAMAAGELQLTSSSVVPATAATNTVDSKQSFLTTPARQGQGGLVLPRLDIPKTESYYGWDSYSMPRDDAVISSSGITTKGRTVRNYNSLDSFVYGTSSSNDNKQYRSSKSSFLLSSDAGDTTTSSPSIDQLNVTATSSSINVSGVLMRSESKSAGAHWTRLRQAQSLGRSHKVMANDEVAINPRRLSAATVAGGRRYAAKTLPLSSQRANKQVLLKSKTFNNSSLPALSSRNESGSMVTSQHSLRPSNDESLPNSPKIPVSSSNRYLAAKDKFETTIPQPCSPAANAASYRHSRSSDYAHGSFRRSASVVVDRSVRHSLNLPSHKNAASVSDGFALSTPSMLHRSSRNCFLNRSERFDLRVSDSSHSDNYDSPKSTLDDDGSMLPTLTCSTPDDDQSELIKHRSSDSNHPGGDRETSNICATPTSILADISFVDPKAKVTVPNLSLPKNNHDNGFGLAKQMKEGCDDPRKNATTFEKTVEKVFGLSPRDGKDKFLRALEKIKHREHADRHEANEKGSNKQVARKQWRNDEEYKHTTRESNQQRKAGSGFANTLKRASMLLVKQKRTIAAMKSTKQGSRDAVGDATTTAVLPDDGSDYGVCPLNTERKDMLLERQLEAIFVSFALFGKWDGDAMVMGHECQGIVFMRFNALCKAAGLLNGHVSSTSLQNLFHAHANKGTAHSIMSFHNFICALEALAACENVPDVRVYRAVLALNVEKRICVHTK